MYKNYLKSKHWIEKKKEFYNQAFRYSCYFCGERRGLQIHHITYKNLGNELIDDLIYVCKKHHEYITFSKEKDKIQAWLERIRKRNIKQRQKFSQNFKKKLYRKNKYKSKFFTAKIPKRTASKNYAGLFTWKADEVGRI